MISWVQPSVSSGCLSSLMYENPAFDPLAVFSDQKTPMYGSASVPNLKSRAETRPTATLMPSVLSGTTMNGPSQVTPLSSDQQTVTPVSM